MFQLFVYRLKTVKKCFGVFLGAILVIVGYIFTLIEENLTSKLICLISFSFVQCTLKIIRFKCDPEVNTQLALIQTDSLSSH